MDSYSCSPTLLFYVLQQAPEGLGPALGYWVHLLLPSHIQQMPLFSRLRQQTPLCPGSFCRSENNCYLYGVFNGYDGNRVTNFVGERLSAELLLGQLNADHDDADVRRVLLQVKFQSLCMSLCLFLQRDTSGSGWGDEDKGRDWYHPQVGCSEGA